MRRHAQAHTSTQPHTTHFSLRCHLFANFHLHEYFFQCSPFSLHGVSLVKVFNITYWIDMLVNGCHRCGPNQNIITLYLQSEPKSTREFVDIECTAKATLDTNPMHPTSHCYQFHPVNEVNPSSLDPITNE